jgi:TPR repeat protein
MSRSPSECDGERDNDNKPQRKRATQRGPFVGDAAAAVGYLWASASSPSLIPEFPPSEAPGRNQAAAPATLASAPRAPAQLLVSAERAQQADQPAPLAISARGVAADASIVIAGLAPGSAMSAGAPAGPNAWQLPTANLRDAAVMPPRGFVGVMNLTLELRLGDGTVLDRTGLQLDWAGKDNLASSEPQRQLDAAEIALLLKNGTVLMGNGDIVAARLMFQRAAEAGDAPAAFALAETYDPAVLEKMGTKGAIKADIALAQKWYAKAKDLGSTAARERLARIPQRP